jgi:hypothetical protein
MEPLKITDIFKKSTMYMHINSIQDSNAVSKTTKHRLDEYDERNTFETECPMYKVQKLDESELQKGQLIPNHLEALSQVLLDNTYQFKEIDFDLESFLKELSTLQGAESDTPSITIKDDKTLAELKVICDEPIKTTSVEEYEIVKKDIQKIADFLQDTYTIETSDKLEANFNDKLKMLFNSLIFKNYDFSKGAFNPESETILYKQLYKVNVYINKTETREFTIYFGFPFYLSIRINMLGEVFIARKNIYKLLEKSEEIDKIHYYSANTGFNVLDLITALKFIGIITSKYFATGFDLLSKLLQTIEKYKTNSEKLTFNNVKLNFNRFVSLYKKVITNLSTIPFQD